MIVDATILAEMRTQWSAVQALAEPERGVVPLVGLMYVLPDKDARYYNLPLLLAFAALEQVLDELIAQGTVPRPKGRQTLQSKMAAANGPLQWLDYSHLDGGRVRRNALAHEAVLVGASDCRSLIAAIGAQLLAWGVLTQ
jgi:hypothetical protein